MGPADTPTLRAGLTKVGVGSRSGSVAARAGPPRAVSRRAKRAVKTEVRCTFRADSKRIPQTWRQNLPILGPGVRPGRSEADVR